MSHFDIQNPILTFKLGPNIEFLHSKSYFDIKTGSEYFILTSNLGRISHFDNLNSYFTFEFGPTHFNMRNPILTFEFRPNIAFDIQNSILSFR